MRGLSLSSGDGSRGWIFCSYDDTPGSVNHNANKRGRHWSQDRAHKQEWEGIYLALFMANRLPRKLSSVKVWFQLEFTDPGRRRDPENQRHPIVKPFADSLVVAGYLPDDTADYFTCMDVTISDRKLVVTKGERAMGKKSRLHIALLYRVAPDALESHRAGGTRLQASTGLGGMANGRGTRG